MFKGYPGNSSKLAIIQLESKPRSRQKRVIVVSLEVAERKPIQNTYLKLPGSKIALHCQKDIIVQQMANVSLKLAPLHWVYLTNWCFQHRQSVFERQQKENKKQKQFSFINTFIRSFHMCQGNKCLHFFLFPFRCEKKLVQV